MSFQEKLEAYYSSGIEEDRLRKDSPHYLEYLTANKYLDQYLPENATILDSCAGTGIYAFRLAERGHSVIAGDLVSLNVDLMNEKQAESGKLADIYQGDTKDLSRFADASFDAVPCMGALYHLPDYAERKQVVGESLRVLKEGGLLVCTYMNRHAVIFNNCTESLEDIDEILNFAQSGKIDIFYASTPEEMMQLYHTYGIEICAHTALDGMYVFMTETSKRLNKKGAQRWQRYHFSVCETPSLLGFSYHNMIIGRK